jgi:UDP-N-acetylmuramoylalanine-D-glutamate ligase
MYLSSLTSLSHLDRIAIVGLGQENLQFLEWLIQVVGLSPEQILIADKNEINLSTPILKDFILYPTNIFSGENYLKVLFEGNIKQAFKAPGIWSLKPEFNDFRQKHGQDSIQSSLVFFFEKYREQIIAITGTKGKSTTSSLVNHLLKSDDTITSHYCGNTTNISPYQFWTDLDQVVNPNEFFVVETSSFQLQDLDYAHISPKYGIITNYYLDHQDQHGSPEEYWRAKDTLYTHQQDGEKTLITETVVQKSQQKDKLTHASVIDSGFAAQISSKFHSTLEGAHNQSNLALAILMCLSITDNVNHDAHDNILALVDKYHDKIQSSLSRFQPLAHRQQVFASFSTPITIETKTVDKTLELTVRFVDDGAATEPDAVIAAIGTLTHEPHKYLWLFIAGKDKGVILDDISRTILETQLKNQLFRINYCGQIGQNILTNIYKSLGTNLQAPFELFREALTHDLTSKQQIVKEFQIWLTDQISQLEELNEQDKIKSILAHNIELNIALSPCGTGFDEFANYLERASWFQEQVNKLMD